MNKLFFSQTENPQNTNPILPVSIDLITRVTASSFYSFNIHPMINHHVKSL